MLLLLLCLTQHLTLNESADWIASTVFASAEARNVAMLNAQDTAGVGQGARFLLGGTTVHNSRSFLDMVQDAAARFPGSIARPPAAAISASAGGGGNNASALNLSIGPVQLAVGGRGGGRTSSAGGGGGAPGGAGGLLDPGRVGEAAEGARDLAQGLFGRLRGAVEHISLP